MDPLSSYLVSLFFFRLSEYDIFNLYFALYTLPPKGQYTFNLNEIQKRYKERKNWIFGEVN